MYCTRIFIVIALLLHCFVAELHFLYFTCKICVILCLKL